MTYRLTQLGHNVQNRSVTGVSLVNMSTTRRPVELSCIIVAVNTSTTQLTRLRVELSCVAINGAVVVYALSAFCRMTADSRWQVCWISVFLAYSVTLHLGLQ